MTKIEIYDADYQRLSNIADYNDISVHELISMIMDSADDEEICDTLELENPTWKGYDT